MLGGLYMERQKVPVAVHLILIKDDKILLLRRFNTGFADGCYGLVAGHVDGDETIVEAMSREVLEEAGIIIQPEWLSIVQVMYRKKPEEMRIDYFLTAERWEGNISNCEPEKCDDISWFDINNMPLMMVPYMAAGIEYYKQSIPFTMFGFNEDDDALVYCAPQLRLMT